MSVYLLAALDATWREAELLRDRLVELEIEVTLVDMGYQGTPSTEVVASIAREEVFTAARTTLDAMQQAGNPTDSMHKASEGVAAILAKALTKKKVDGVFAIGDGITTRLAAAAMWGLPMGLPKLIVSPLASGHARSLVGDKDIVLLHSIVQLPGINRITRTVLYEAAAAMAGMVENRFTIEDAGDRPLVAVTVNPFTLPGLEVAQHLLAQAGFEVLTFQSDDHGGYAMESLIRDGAIVGVLDLTTNELADEIAGGIQRHGPARLTAAAAKAVPQVVCVGGLDAAHISTSHAQHDGYRDRKQHAGNDGITLIRTTVDENKKIGKDLGKKLAKAKGQTLLMLPKQGVSSLDGEGQPFNDPAARRALFEAIYGSCGKCEVVELENHINDREFAEAAARRLTQMIAAPA